MDFRHISVVICLVLLPILSVAQEASDSPTLAVIQKDSLLIDAEEIIEIEGMKADECFDYIINTIPNQGTETVRTEEAIHATLALLNMF